MNIFFLDLCPILAARMYCDMHMKIILEICQMLSTAFYFNDSTLPEFKIYKKTHANHPTAMWVRASKENWMWTVIHGLELCNEYYRRYGQHKSREHACRTMLEKFIIHLPNFKFVKSSTAVYSTTQLMIFGDKCTPVPLCVEDKEYSLNLVDSYRNYYKTKTFATWKFTEKPEWINI